MTASDGLRRMVAVLLCLSACTPAPEYVCAEYGKVPRQVCVDEHKENVLNTGNNLDRALVGMSEYVTVCDRYEERMVDGCVKWETVQPDGSRQRGK